MLAMSDEKTITGELLERAKKENEQAIKKNNLTAAELAILRGQSLIYLFIEKDHEKVEKMFDAFEEEETRRKERNDTNIFLARTAWGGAITSIVVLVINGIVWFVKILPLLNKLSTP